LSFLAVLFTSLVFVAYDAVIEKRQRKVMQSATRSSAIVSSLFPLKVRTRLYEESAPALSEKEQSPQNRLKNFLVKAHTSSIEPMNTEPIADLFESTTVLFADIKGFTNWYVLFGKDKLPSCFLNAGGMSQEFVPRTDSGFHLVGDTVWFLRQTCRNVGSVQGE
jgi:hypothetical protein